MQTFAAVGFEKGLVRALIVPGLVRSAGLHGRQHMHQAGLRAALLNDFGDALFFTRLGLADELDLDTLLARQPLGIGAQAIALWFSKTRVVEDANAALDQK